MSGSMTNVEIDDVLSSIRRLVSEGDADTAASGAADNDRLVLTPALRVPGDAVDSSAHRPTPVLVESPQSETAQSETPADGGDSPQVQELAELLAGARSDADRGPAQADDTPDSEHEPSTRPDLDSAQYQAMETAWQAELARVSTERDSDGDALPQTPVTLATADPGPKDSDAPQSLELRIAELEEAVGKTQEDWEPDGSEPDIKQAPRRHIFEVVNNTKPASPEPIPDPEPDDGADVSPVFTHVRRPTPFLLSDAISLPTASADDAAHPVQDGPVAPQSGADVVEDDDIFLDVETLRTMITDVVREELRGNLGESITRNVRRMVHQEIARAITMKKPDDDDTA